MDKEQAAINRAYDRDKLIELRLGQEHQRGQHKKRVDGCSACFYSRRPHEAKGD